MKSFFSLVALLITIFALSPKLGRGQTVDTIFGCDELPTSVGEGKSCTICDFDILYGTTFPFTPSEDAGWCGTIENDQYIGFIAGPTGSITYQIQSFNCTNGRGIQIGIYDQDNTLVDDCFNQVAPGVPQIFAASSLFPGEVYYIRIDGFEGDGCEFIIQVISGLGTDTGSFDIDVVNGQSIVRYIQGLCPSAPPSGGSGNSSGCSYQIDYSLEPDSLPFIVFNPSNVDTFQVITWPDSMAQRVLLVQELNLTENNSSGTCPDSTDFSYYSHFLDLRNNDLISEKVWECDSERVVGLINPKGTSTQLTLLESGIQTYTISAAGFFGMFGSPYSNYLYDISVRQGRNEIFSESFYESDSEFTFTVDFDQGPIDINFYNEYPWPMEVALERSAPGEPWSIKDIDDKDTVCVGYAVRGSGVISPDYITNVSSGMLFEFEFLSYSLVNNQGTSIPTNPTIDSRAYNSSILIDNIALPGDLIPGNYVFTGILRPTDDLTTICGLNDSFEFRHEFNVLTPDTSVIQSIQLADTRDSVTLFYENGPAYHLVTNVPGTYYIYVNCIVYEQTLLPSLVNIDLGVDTLCAGECLFAPTSETISCNSGAYVFTASNDTTYIGNLHVDSAQTILVETVEYVCDSLTGEWSIDLSWSGSYGPYLLDDTIYNDTIGRAGPFQNGETVDILLTGSSICVDTIFINGSYSCLSNTQSIQQLGFQITPISSSVLEVTAPSYGWQLRIIDILGREVLTTALQRDANQLFVGDLLPGTYFLVAHNGSQRASDKWVKR